MLKNGLLYKLFILPKFLKSWDKGRQSGLLVSASGLSEKGENLSKLPILWGFI